MRWKTKDSEDEKLLKWHKWFAWKPITIGDTRIWLEYVYRKGSKKRGYSGWYIDFEYNLEGQL